MAAVGGGAWRRGGGEWRRWAVAVAPGQQMRHVPGVHARVVAVLACAVAVALPLVAAGQRPPRGAAPPASAPPAPPAPPVATELPGWPLYDRLCLACHGVRGDGRGPAAPWLDPLPRDLAAGRFKWGGTADAQAPAPAAVAAAIRWGAPGTAMHGFDATLTARDVERLVDVVLALAGRPVGPGVAAPGARAWYAIPGLDPDGKRAQVERGRALWVSLGCVTCHGEGGKGDGPASATLVDAAGQPARPYDLTAWPVRRPRPPDATVEEAILASVVEGVGGTAMASFHGAAPLPDLMAVAAYVATLGPREVEAVPDLTAATIARDRGPDRARAGYRWGAADDPDGALFGGELAPQGEPPAALAPAQAALSSRQCGRCHAKQVREWQGSLHAAAASPGLMGQVARLDRPAEVRSCMRCHAPLAEQEPRSPFLDVALQAEGLTCAACHVRDGVRHGPAGRAPSLLPLPGYPLRELPVYGRADFCVGCHQLPARLAVGGRPLLDTYREWLLGPYMKRGIQCQHCHMPNREHTWKGIHDPETFRQGIGVTAIAARGASGVVSVRARLANVGAGHYLPTTPTPAAWFSIELVDQDGRAIAGTRLERRIGRHLRFARGAFEEIEDTRLPPGGHVELAQGFRRGRVAAATHVRVQVRVRPDDYYEGLYKARLRAKLDPWVRAQFETALARAEANAYVAYDQLWPIEGTGSGVAGARN
ncbi:MAG: c-type cytochrome [Kofleriaceae bacterium]|nr:c-type cytochrome [Kofleriaceae bacterium]